MSTAQESPTRRHTVVAWVALAAVVGAVVVTVGTAAGVWGADAARTSQGSVAGAALPVPAASAETDTSPIARAVAPEVGVVEQVQAADGEVDFAAATPQVTVSLPPEPSPEPVAVAPEAQTVGAQGGNGSSGSGHTASKKSGGTGASEKATSEKAAPAVLTPSQFCAAPSVSASASSPQGLLAAANAERSRLGLSSLSWSGSLAAAATAWSQAMAAKDDTTADVIDALAHNPNRPAGGENVAVAYSSAGQSQGGAASIAHSGWVKSHGHCMNMLNPGFSVMGAGMAVTADGTTWYTTANYQ